MKNLNILLLLLLLLTIACYSEQKMQPIEQVRPNPMTLNGFWERSFSTYDDESSHNQIGCPTPDAWHESNALGTHIFMEEDSISLFRYPFEYYGTFKYEITNGVLHVNTNQTSTTQFVLQKPDENTILLNFEEAFNPSCLLGAEAKYERFTPDVAIIKKLLLDSISFNSLAGQWWYLEKEISHGDGSEPTILKFPKGMPDSIFVSQEMINQNPRQPFIELKLKKRLVKMFFKQPAEYTFILEPALKKDKILFSEFIDYGAYGGIDTIYHEVLYHK